MAYTTAILQARAGFVEMALAKLSSLNEYREKYANYRKTVRELQALGNNELSDLGIARCEIDSIARKSCNFYK